MDASLTCTDTEGNAVSFDNPQVYVNREPTFQADSCPAARIFRPRLLRSRMGLLGPVSRLRGAEKPLKLKKRHTQHPIAGNPLQPEAEIVPKADAFPPQHIKRGYPPVGSGGMPLRDLTE